MSFAWHFDLGRDSRIAVIATVILLAVSSTAFAAGKLVNFDAGVWDDGGLLNYTDAHIELSTLGTIPAAPAPTTIDGGFPKPMPTITHGGASDTITVDWGPKAMSGGTHIGVKFPVDPRAPGGKTGVTVIRARLTGVTGDNHGNMFGPNLALPEPDIRATALQATRPGITPAALSSGSVGISLSIDDPAITAPVTFSNVKFYTVPVEPPLADLTAANFSSLGATLVQSVPGTFALSSGGPPMTLTLNGVNYSDWIITTSRTSWSDPSVTIKLGHSVDQTVDSWFATQPDVLSLPGDTNLDGVVDFADLVVLARNYGMTSATWEQGDFDGDGKVDFSDLVILARNYGQAISAAQLSQFSPTFRADVMSAFAAVPEPSTSVSLVAACLWLLSRRYRLSTSSSSTGWVVESEATSA